MMYRALALSMEHRALPKPMMLMIEEQQAKMSMVMAQQVMHHTVKEEVLLKKDNLKEYNTCDGHGEEASQDQRDGAEPDGDALGQGGDGDGQRGARVMVRRMGRVRMAKRYSTRQLSLSNFLSTGRKFENERGHSVITGSSGAK